MTDDFAVSAKMFSRDEAIAKAAEHFDAYQRGKNTGNKLAASKEPLLWNAIAKEFMVWGFHLAKEPEDGYELMEVRMGW